MERERNGGGGGTKLRDLHEELNLVAPDLPVEDRSYLLDLKRFLDL